MTTFWIEYSVKRGERNKQRLNFNIKSKFRPKKNIKIIPELTYKYTFFSFRFRLDLYDDRLGRHVLDDDDDGCGGGRELLRVDAVQLSGEPLLDSNADDDTCCAALGDDGEPIGDDHEWVAAIGCRFTKAIIGRVGDDEANEALIDAHLQSEAFLAHDDRPQYLTSHYLPTSTVPAYDATAGTTLWEEDMRRLCRPDYFNTS